MRIRQTYRRFLALALATALLAALTAVAITPFDAAPASATTYAPTLTTWTTATSGTLGSVTVTATTNSPSTMTMDLSGTSFDPAGSATTPMLDFAAPDPVSFSFTSTIANPVLYFRYMRGPNGFGGPATMTFSASGGACSWSIRSGFTGAALNGAVLTLPNGFSNGIIQCTGTPSGVGWTPAGGDGGGSGSLVTVGFLTDVTPTTSSSTSTTSTMSTTTIPTTRPVDSPSTTSIIAPDDPVAPAFTG